MVAPVSIPTFATEKSAKSSQGPWYSESGESRVSRISSLSAAQSKWNLTGAKTGSQSTEIPSASSFGTFSTGTEIPSGTTETDGTNFLFFYSPKPEGKTPLQSRLVNLPSRGRLVTTFEPHLRQSALKELQSLFTQFQYSIGRPTAAVAKAELVDTLTRTYKRSALSDETRNFASAISLLQDFLRPHWSEIRPETVECVGKIVGGLVSRNELGPSALEGFYREMLAVVGTGISVDVEPEDEEAELGGEDE